MNEQIQKWSGEFGNEYTSRNRVNWRARIPFWDMMMTGTGARSVHEVGCNAGWNLSAIKSAAPYVSLRGNDINATAVFQARMAGLDVLHNRNLSELYPGTVVVATVELVFTCGVLIHVAPESLQEVMRSIIDVSCQYVLAIEYASEKQEQVIYRNHVNMLWKRPYGKLYEEMGLKLVETGDAGPGFDNCQYWLMEKQ